MGSSTKKPASLKALRAEIFAHPKYWVQGLIVAFIILLIPAGCLSIIPLVLIALFLVVHLCTRLTGARQVLMLVGTLLVGVLVSIAIELFFLFTWMVPMGVIGLYGVINGTFHEIISHESIDGLVLAAQGLFFVLVLYAIYLAIFSSLYVTIMAAWKLSKATDKQSLSI